MDKKLAPIKQRINQLIDYKKVKRNIFFDRLEVSASNFRSKGLYSEVGGEVIAKISSFYPDLNLDWLLTGEGAMLRDAAKVSQEIKGDGNYMAGNELSISGSSINELKAIIKEQKAVIKEKEELIKELLAQQKKLIDKI